MMMKKASREHGIYKMGGIALKSWAAARFKIIAV
jgi:hypothetical protein